MDQAELDEQDRFDRRKAREKVETRRQELRSAVVRRARDLRDKSSGDPDLAPEWEALDDAIRALDDFAASQEPMP